MDGLTGNAAPGVGRGAREVGQVARLALPLAAVHLGNHLMGFVDAIIAGHLSPQALAGTGMGTSIFFAVSVIGMGVVLGLDPLASQAFGAGRPRQARRGLWQGLYTAVLIAVPLTAAAVALAYALDRLGVVATTAGEARRYILARLPSLVFLLAAVAARAYLQAAHAARSVLVATLTANLFNAPAGFVLAFGDAGLARLGLPAVGLPGLGVVGLGLGAALATMGQLVLLGIAVRALPVGAGAEPVRAFDWPMVRRLLALGFPIGLMMATEVSVFALAQVLIGGMSVASGAAHQAAITFASLSFSVCMGIGAATSVQVGRAVGRGDREGTRRAGIAGIGLGAAFMLLPGLLMALVPERLAALVTSDASVLPLATTLLRIAAVFQLVDGIQAVASGALRGAGVTRWAFGANVVAHWIIGVPVGLTLAFGAGLGAAGVWWGLTAGLVAIAAALAAKFMRVSRGRIAALAPGG